MKIADLRLDEIFTLLTGNLDSSADVVFQWTHKCVPMKDFLTIRFDKTKKMIISKASQNYGKEFSKNRIIRLRVASVSHHSN